MTRLHLRSGRAIALAGLGVALLSCATNPVTGRRELSLVSESQEIQMGLQAAKEAAVQMGVYPDSQLQRYVSSLGMPLARSSERPSLPWSFTVIDDPMVNAFALPGGPVFVTRGILAYMNSEAQLVSVLGHEIGHITARHSVNQMSRAQLAQIGLVGAMIAAPELQQFGNLGSQALGVMFMKFGRDDETQSDDLGFRYMTAASYDPAEMAEMFRTLERTSAGSERAPEWLSTHPDPGNRVEKTRERIAAWSRPAGALKVNRDAFLQHIDGIVFGDDPRQGYFQQQVFYHPSMKFRLDFPSGWRTQNAPTQVAAVSTQQDAIIVLSAAGNAAPSQAAAQFANQQGVRALGTSTNSINGLPAAVTQFTAQAEQTVLAGYAAFVQLDGATFQILAYAPQPRIASYDGAFRAAIGSFQRVTDARVLGVKPQRLRLVRLASAMTLAQFQQQYPSPIPIEQLAVINGVENANALFPAGSRVKRVVVE
ncbi:MAG: M48 family metalloprotease [Gemmatimonadaceae bacterium]|nr:M48 family metalloprotease [Gemmatimonadaceae bacterium]